MKLIASLLASAVLSVATVAAHADTVAPGISLDLTSGTTSYTFAELTPNTFTFADGTQNITAIYVGVPGLLDSFAITDVCLTINLLHPCKTYSLAVTDTHAAGVSLAAGLSAAAVADTTLSAPQLATVKLDGSIGLTADTINFALPSTPPVNSSPVPEPGTLSLLATGLLGAAGAVRRRFLA